MKEQAGTHSGETLMWANKQEAEQGGENPDFPPLGFLPFYFTIHTQHITFDIIPTSEASPKSRPSPVLLADGL